MIRFAAPEWLVLLPLLALAGWYAPRLGLARPLRALCLALLLALLMEPQLRRHGSGLDLWVLTDRSASCADLVEPRLPEMRQLLEKSRPHRDRLFWMDFADLVEPREDAAATTQVFTGNRRATRLNTAIQHTLSRLDPDRAARLLVLTDGYSTEPLAAASLRLQDQQVPMDYRLFAHPDGTDYRVADFGVPVRTARNEPFLVEAYIEGEPAARVPYVLLRDGATLSSGEVEVREGRGALRFTDRLAQAGAHRYELRIQPTADAFPGNNRAARWIEATGAPRLLLVTAYKDDPLAAALAGQGFEVDVSLDAADLHAGRLAGARAVIFNNVPAYRVPAEVLGALDFYVRQQGGGFLMAGGKFSFGAGGYFESPVDPLLPVSMELKQEHRKLAVSMAIVLDRSGSMAAGVPGGRTKMDLADEGAARAVELLGGLDKVSVIAVDSAPHVIAPLVSVGENRSSIISETRRIQSTGGGIFVYTGLLAAWKELKGSNSGQKHIILFADAADAEEPGQYVQLLEEITRAGATVSVIGMGTEADCDAAFLKDVALRGKGRIFFNADAASLPALFAQETVAVSRSAFLDEAVAYKPAAGWHELAARPLDWLPAVDGYNLSYLREGATAAALSGDEYAAPLVAFWQRGLGRVAAVSFPLGGDFSARVRGWASYGDFARTVTRWLMGQELPPGLGLRTTRDGSVLRVELGYNADWEPRIARHAPELVTSESGSDRLQRHAWRRLEPGHYVTEVPLEEERWIRGAVQVGGHALPFGPVNSGSEVEWRFDRERIAELKQAAERCGGAERLDLTSVWKAPRRAEFEDFRAPLLWLLLLLVLADALATRLGWQRPEWLRLPVRVKGPAVKASVPAAAPARKREVMPEEPSREKAAPSTPATPPAPPSEPASPASRRSVFDRAKRGGV